LCGIVEQPAHLLCVQAGQGPGSRGGAEESGDAMGALVTLHLKVQGPEGHGYARPNVVSERHSAQKLISCDAEFFAYRQCGGYHRAAWMRL
jgi:hypothetical protein